MSRPIPGGPGRTVRPGRRTPPRGPTAQQWARCCATVWTSCAAALPPSREDAKTQTSVTCAFLAFTDRVVGSVQLDLVLTQDLIQRFLIDSEGKVGAGTRRNRRGHLRRALKAAAGDAPRVTHSPRSAGAEPYAAAELDKLAAAAFSRATLAAALACGLELGLRPRARPSVVSPATAVPPSIRQP